MIYSCKNRKKKAAKQREYHAENLEKINSKKKVHYTENRGEILAKQKVSYAENREERLAKQKVYVRKSKYGLSPGDFNRMLAEQGGVCAICGDSGGVRGLCIDHDHKNGLVRALLCNLCNTGLGMFKDSSIVVTIAAEYLKRHEKNK